MKKNLILTALVACFIVLSLAATSEAGSPYAIIYGEASASPSITAYFANVGGWFNGVQTTYWVDLDFTSSNRPDPYYFMDNTRYIAWCVEAQFSGQNISGNLVTNFSSIDLLQADWLIYHYAASPHQSDQNAALQIAIWEAAIDGTHDLNAGNFRYNTAGYYLNQANTYLNLLGAANLSSWTNTTGWVKDGSLPSARYYQDFLIQPLHPIPEPSALLLLGAGLIGFSVISRYRRSKKE